MRKINLKSIFISIFVLGVIIFSTWIMTAQYIEKEVGKKYNLMLSSVYANIIYAFSTKKEKNLLKVSTGIIRIQIIDIGKDNKNKFSSYSYLCPMINKKFKKIILNNLNEEEKEYLIHKQEFIDSNVSISFKSEREDFIIGYKKLLNLCKSKM